MMNRVFLCTPAALLHLQSVCTIARFQISHYSAPRSICTGIVPSSNITAVLISINTIGNTAVSLIFYGFTEYSAVLEYLCSTAPAMLECSHTYNTQSPCTYYITLLYHVAAILHMLPIHLSHASVPHLHLIPLPPSPLSASSSAIYFLLLCRACPQCSVTFLFSQSRNMFTLHPGTAARTLSRAYAKLSWSLGVKRCTSLNHRQERRVVRGVWARKISAESGISARTLNGTKGHDIVKQNAVAG